MNLNFLLVDMLQVTLSFDETTTIADVDQLFKLFADGKNVSGQCIFHCWLSNFLF